MLKGVGVYSVHQLGLFFRRVGSFYAGTRKYPPNNIVKRRSNERLFAFD